MGTADRGYVLRFRPDGSTEDEYIAVNTFTVQEYGCGARAGDSLRLKRALPVTDDSGRVDQVHLPGEIWVVLTGAVEDPSALWLRQPDGKLHCWSDDDTPWEHFDEAASNSSPDCV